MCATCGFPAAPGHWTEAGTAGSAHERVRARFRRAQVLQAILPAFGLTAHDNIQTPGILLGTMTGDQLIVPDLTALWTAAEALSGRRIDPLDPAFLGSPPQKGEAR